jgi:hypothetical protein
LKRITTKPSFLILQEAEIRGYYQTNYQIRHQLPYFELLFLPVFTHCLLHTQLIEIRCIQTTNKSNLHTPPILIRIRNKKTPRKALVLILQFVPIFRFCIGINVITPLTFFITPPSSTTFLHLFFLRYILFRI